MSNNAFATVPAPASETVPPITGEWALKDKIYVGVVAPIMIMALLEWILWILAFTYCLLKVYRKAEHWSQRVLAIVMIFLFMAFRLAFLPVMIVTLPLPGQITQYFPEGMVSGFQWFAFWAFALLLMIPWLFCVFQIVTQDIGRAKRVKNTLDEQSAPKMVVVMPCYNEDPDILLVAINSVVDCDYPPTCIHVFVSFDGDQISELYLRTMENLGCPPMASPIPASIDVCFRGVRVTISRFKHGGKRNCQKMTFKLIDKVYADYLKAHDNLFILFIDSDCILDKVCIQNFMYDMELKPGSKHNMLAMTGVITSTTVKDSWITVLQDMEYIHGQLFERSVESACGAVTCLPGALTCLRFSAFRRMAKYYFSDKANDAQDLFDYGKTHLGEDRWLTHLFMIGAKEKYQIQMCTGAFCKTEAVQTWKSLLKQRRRWFLGFITNEVCMLTDARIWWKYPLLGLLRFANNTIRTTALLFFIMVISLVTTSQKVGNLPVGFIAVSLGLNWLLMLYFGVKLGRYKILLYPFMFVVNPFVNWIYMVYGIFTAGQRTWGGPRADAATADEDTTVQETIEKAEKTGDDLNIVPETFVRAKSVVKREPSKRVPLQPPNEFRNRFAAPDRNTMGFIVESSTSLSEADGLQPPRPRPLSHASVSSTGASSIVQPRMVESIVGIDGLRQYQEAQRNQAAPGGQHFLDGGHQATYGSQKYPYDVEKQNWNDSSESFASDSRQVTPTNTNGNPSAFRELDRPPPAQSRPGHPPMRDPRKR